MNPYNAPLAEMRFALRELADLEAVAQLADAEVLADASLTNAILEQAARFSRDVLAPLDSIGDREGARWNEQGVSTAPGFVQAYKQFVEAGWNSVAIASTYGGQGLPSLLYVALQEMFVSSNKAFCYCPELTASAVKTLGNAASDALKHQYIPHLASGRWAGTMNLTEPQAGSDVGALRSRALPQADGSYRLFGQKIFISYGEHDLTENIVHLVLARTPGAPEGSKGVSLFVVPKFLPEGDGLGRRNDVRCAGIEHKLGNHASPTCTLVYGGEGEGAVGWLVGEENKGLQAMFIMVNSSRFNVGMEAVAMSERAYQQALLYARERIQGRAVGAGSAPVAIIHHPDVRRLLLLMRSQTEAMRGLAYVLAAERDLAERHPDPAVRRERRAFVDLMIPIFKGWASETAIEVTSASIQVHGGLGYIEESGASQPLRDVRVTSIYEGTTAIQAHDLVERKLVRDGGEALQAWLARVEASLQTLRARQEPVALQIATALAAALQALREAAGWALEQYPRQPREVLCGSVALLTLCGIVAGGWQLARAAQVALRQLEQGEGDVAFLRRKLLSAQFYAGHVLPQAAGLAAVAMHAGESALLLDDEAF